MSERILDYQTPRPIERGELPPVLLLDAIYHLVFGCFSPVLCFLGADHYYESIDKGSRSYSNHALQILTVKFGWMFYPFLAHAIVSLIAAIMFPQKSSSSAFIRMGLFGGVILSLQYIAIIAIYFGGLDPGREFSAIGAFFLMLCAAFAILCLGTIRRAAVREMGIAGSVIFVGVLVALMIIATAMNPIAILFLVAVPIAGAPAMCLVSYVAIGLLPKS
jgi:hypothetical protein